jgi:hypothetical protein
MKNIFTEHPHSVGESYWMHLYFAGVFGGKMVIGGLACLIHAVLPFAFKKTGSYFLLKLTRRFVERMPELDDSVLQLSAIIDSKKAHRPAPSVHAK